MRETDELKGLLTLYYKNQNHKLEIKFYLFIFHFKNIKYVYKDVGNNGVIK